MGWAISYLYRAGLIKRVDKARYQITDRGKKALQDGNITVDCLRQRRFEGKKKKKNMNLSSFDMIDHSYNI